MAIRRFPRKEVPINLLEPGQEFHHLYGGLGDMDDLPIVLRGKLIYKTPCSVLVEHETIVYGEKMAKIKKVKREHISTESPVLPVFVRRFPRRRK